MAAKVERGCGGGRRRLDGGLRVGEVVVRWWAMAVADGGDGVGGAELQEALGRRLTRAITAWPALVASTQ